MKLALFFNLEPGEEKLVFLNFLQAFLVGFPRLFTLMIANSLFLEHYSASNLPFIYLSSSVVVLLMGFIRFYFEKRISFIKLQTGTLLVLFLVSLTFFLLLWFTSYIWLIIALYIWLAVEIIMTDIVLWGVANRLFTVRQSKRLFSLIGAGSILTVILGGFITPYLIELIGTRGLLIFSASGFFLAFLNLLRIYRTFKLKFITLATFPKGGKESDHFSLSTLLHNRYLILTATLFICFSQIIYLFVDNIFYHQLNAYYPNAEQLASFIGRFWAIYGVLSLFFRTLLAGRWMAHVGIFGGIFTSQMVIGICMFFILLYHNLLFSSGVIIFWIIAATKQLDRILTGAVTQPAYLTLYQPLPAEQRTRAQTVTESIIGPIGGILASLMLLLFTALGAGPIALSAILLVIIIFYGFICHLAIKEYRQALTVILNRRGFAGTELSLDDAWSLQILEKGLESHRPKEVLYCLKLLEEVKHPRLNEHLLQLINHPQAEVREGVYQTIERLTPENCFHCLKDRLTSEIPSLRGTLLRALGAIGDAEVFDLLEPYLDEEQPEVRQGAMVALVRHCGIEGAVGAGGSLMRLMKSLDSTERKFAATVLGQIGISTFYRGLMLLLEDQNVEVRKAALIAAGQLNNRKLWSLVIANLNLLPTRESAVKALLQAGESALPSLELAYNDLHQSLRVRREIIHLYGRIRSKEAIALLLKKLHESDSNLRYETFWSLHLCGYQATGQETSTIEQLLLEEVIQGVKVLTAQRDLVNLTEAALLYAALSYELEKTQARIFLLLSTIYPADLIMRTWSNFKEPSLEKQDLAIELLDNTISKDHKAVVMPLLEMHRQRQNTSEYTEEPFSWIVEIVTEPKTWNNSWVRVCAIDAMAQIPAAAEFMNAHLFSLLSDEESLVREVARSIFQKETLSGTLSVVEKVKLLRTVSIFSKIPDEILAEAAHFLEMITVQSGKTVFHKGELGTSMYIIIQGILRVHDGDNTLAELGAGNIFGEFSALDPEPRMASVTAISQSLLFKISQEELHTLIESHIEVAKGIIQILCQRLRTSLAKTKNEPPRQNNVQTPTKMEPLTLIHGDDLSLIEKVIILKTVSIFADTPDNILSDIANLTEETYLHKGETLFKKGDVGTSMYIVVSGRIQVHDSDRIIAELGERALIGEMAVLSSEPRTASVTATTDTLLLSLTQTALFELMWDQNKIVRGIIQVLIQRLRSLRE